MGNSTVSAQDTERSAPEIEAGSIITISTEHLSIATMEILIRNKGDIPEGPSAAVREEGCLVNSHLDSPDALELDFNPGRLGPLALRMPDLVLIRALARGLKAEWINFDRDGVEYADILPIYSETGVETTPTKDGWAEALSTRSYNAYGLEAIVPTREVLEMIEAGQTPQVFGDDPEP